MSISPLHRQSVTFSGFESSSNLCVLQDPRSRSLSISTGRDSLSMDTQNGISIDQEGASSLSCQRSSVSGFSESGLCPADGLERAEPSSSVERSSIHADHRSSVTFSEYEETLGEIPPLGDKKIESPSIKDLDEFPKVRFEVKEEIGKGSFGFILGAYDKDLKRPVVIKKMLKNQIDSALQEWQSGFIMYNNPNIPKVYKLYKDKDFLYLVQDLIKGKDLYTWIMSRKEGVPEEVVLYILKKVVTVLIDLHNRGVMHRDIQPRNILLESRKGHHGRVWVIDLGVSSSGISSSYRGRRNSLVGTASHMAPEICDESYDEKVDIWSLGVMFFYMMTGDVPFASSLPDFRSRASDGRRGFILTEKQKELLEKQSSPGARDLIGKMLEFDSEKRINLDSILAHPWMLKEGRSWTESEMEGLLSEVAFTQSFNPSSNKEEAFE